MRWRFVDRIDAFLPWKEIRGRKCVSLEEYCLMARFGREGELPENLTLESFVHLARWFAIGSSGFQSACLLSEVTAFSFPRRIGMGKTLGMKLMPVERNDASMMLKCEGTVDGEMAAGGTLSFRFHPLEELMDTEAIRMIWRELHGAA